MGADDTDSEGITNMLDRMKIQKNSDRLGRRAQVAKQHLKFCYYSIFNFINYPYLWFGFVLFF